MNQIRKSYLYLALVALVLLSFTTGFAARAYLPWFNQSPFPIAEEAYDLIRQRGYNPLPTAPAMEYGMVRGMIQAYGDPYTTFLEPPQAELESNALQGSFGGIGTRLEADKDGYFILYPFPDSPALKAGIQDGDRLLGIDDLMIAPGMPTDKIQAAIRGPVGSTVSISIGRKPDYSLQKFQVKRQEIALPSVTWHIANEEPRLGIVEINIIASTTPDEIQKAVKDLQSRGATSFVMDLRDNGGGLLNSGIEVARLFLKDGVVIDQQYKGQDVEAFNVDKPGPLADIPLVLLVNQNTASAAEIIAGSLQAHKRAELIGYTTYGKNTIQLVYTLSDGSSIHITAALWWIPGLEFPKDKHGLTPDVPLPADNPDRNLATQAAIKILFSK